MFMKLVHRIVFSLFAFLVLSQGLVQADTLSGRVLDPQENVVPDAKIKLFDRNSGQQRNTVSNSDGNFRFESIPSGTYLLEVHGADSVLVSSQEVSIKGDSNVDAKLSIAGVQTDVVVTASTTPLAMTEIAKALDIVDSEQLEVRNVFQITEAL